MTDTAATLVHCLDGQDRPCWLLGRPTDFEFRANCRTDEDRQRWCVVQTDRSRRLVVRRERVQPCLSS